MIKINYPKHRKKFEEDYVAIFDIEKIKKEWEDEFKKIDYDISENSIKKLLVLPFDELLKIYQDFTDNKSIKKNEDDKKTLYGHYQPEIANFFMDYSKELNLKTCYFCNIDFINVFATRFDNVEYKTVLDVIEAKNYDDLILLKGIGPSIANKIIANNINSMEDIEKISGQGIKEENLKKIKNIDISKIDFKSQKNHFTLDHFLPKSKCPILALSLYNFVPSCSSCNTKFKTVQNLEKEHLSPTSSSFSVQDNIKFKFFFDTKVKKDDLNLLITYSKNEDKDYEKYIEAFELENRYKFHQNEALALIKKQEKYSETRIDEIANILKISPHQVKKDIFGEELFNGDIQDKSFTKMKRDVAKNIGIKGVKE